MVKSDKVDVPPEFNETTLEALVPHSAAGERLDQVAAQLFQDYSRARLQEWIKQGALRVNGRQAKVREKMQGGEQLSLEPCSEPQGEWLAEDLPLDIVYEDEQILVLNKAAGVVVHPAAGNYSGTLLNALLHHCGSLISLPRGGIVHRLDKDTTGLMVVAKTLKAHQDLVGQLQRRAVGRHYQAVVNGIVSGGGKVDAALSRHPVHRKKMAIAKHGGKEAVTHYKPVRHFTRHSLLELKLETGRTHQIRVHMQSIGHALVGDPVYGGRARAARALGERARAAVETFPRQALHAGRLQLNHPETGEEIFWQTPLPQDMSDLVAVLGDSND